MRGIIVMKGKRKVGADRLKGMTILDLLRCDVIAVDGHRIRLEQPPYGNVVCTMGNVAKPIELYPFMPGGSAVPFLRTLHEFATGTSD
jgi:hypothetical protein